MIVIIIVQDIIGPVTISPAGPIIKDLGSNFSLVCSANVYPAPHYGSPPILEWLFGPENSSLPSGVTASNVTNNNNHYTRSLQFSSLHESHIGMYTCRIGSAAARIRIFAGGKETTIILLIMILLFIYRYRA